jgi:hypothetical protein
MNENRTGFVTGKKRIHTREKIEGTVCSDYGVEKVRILQFFLIVFRGFCTQNFIKKCSNDYT